jgi:flagellar biosynthesis component FlhA
LNLDTGHLHDAQLDPPVLAVSSTLQRIASQTKDESLLEESGFAQLATYLSTQIVGKREELVVHTAANEMLSAVSQLESQFATERNALADPDRANNLVHQLQMATEQSGRPRPGGRSR